MPILDNAKPSTRFLAAPKIPEAIDPLMETPLRWSVALDNTVVGASGTDPLSELVASTPRLSHRLIGVVAMAAVSLLPTVASTPAAEGSIVRYDPIQDITPLLKVTGEPHSSLTPAVAGLKSARETGVTADISVEGASARRALKAVQELQSWLSISASEVTRLGGFARRNLSNWQTGRGAYGASSRHLLAVHALVSQLVKVQGREGALLWLNAPFDQNRTRIDVLHQGKEGLLSVLQQAEPLLFPTAERRERVQQPYWTDSDSDTAILDEGARRPDLFNYAPRRTIGFSAQQFGSLK